MNGNMGTHLCGYCAAETEVEDHTALCQLRRFLDGYKPHQQDEPLAAFDERRFTWLEDVYLLAVAATRTEDE